MFVDDEAGEPPGGPSDEDRDQGDGEDDRADHPARHATATGAAVEAVAEIRVDAGDEDDPATHQRRERMGTLQHGVPGARPDRSGCRGPGQCGPGCRGAGQ
ncbi:hypothetical protein SDC9_107685 [bioreactor metagenome]|uniref:Uncharacterized protein n=1 Tax=bioreactor metagenome TaxID=1076179 RepID=A0A645B887_9ZZZZ